MLSGCVAEHTEAHLVGLRERVPDPDGGDGLAELVGIPGGFTRGTKDAIAALGKPTERLAAALCSPECLVAQLEGYEHG